MTSNFKKAEIPVKHIVSGMTIKPSNAIFNPKSLDFFYQFAEMDKAGSLEKCKL